MAIDLDGVQIPPPTAAGGRVLRVCVYEGHTLLVTEAGVVEIAALPDRSAARRAVRTLAQLGSVRLDQVGTTWRCTLRGTAHRRPATRSVSLGAALALARAGVPAVVGNPAGGGR